jgi:anti-sigma regulatory factor (Ser/Thr protein kinase)
VNGVSGHAPESVHPGPSSAPVPVPPSRPPTPGPAGWPLASHMTYGPLPDTVPTARTRTKVILREWGPGLDLITQDTLQVVTELVSNAVTASRALVAVPPVRLWLRSDGARVLVQVGDQSPAPPLWRASGVDAEHGRGLLVVQQLSSNWGWYPATSHGLAKVAWAEIHAGPKPSQSASPSAR